MNKIHEIKNNFVELVVDYNEVLLLFTDDILMQDLSQTLIMVHEANEISKALDKKVKFLHISGRILAEGSVIQEAQQIIPKFDETEKL